ncbi:MAG: DNA/RNA non-specific endonuclease [Bacteroidales bacterium]|nr:DNA/RNA non-specific endonuclease [Bacteroidales bacterium]
MMNKHIALVKLLLLTILWMGFSASSCGGPRELRPEDSSSVVQHLEYPAISTSEDIYEYLGFTSSYNHTTLVPDWVAYELTSEELEGTYTSTSNFSRDPQVQGRQASREDYSWSGWDKGHLCPKADLKWSEKAWWESHYFTNVCPQNHDFNAGPWNKLENKVRHWAQQYGQVYVVCGPIFDSCQYGTIGNAMVSIPDAFFKALLIPQGDSYQAIAFIMENHEGRQDIRASAMSVNDLETKINRDLFPALDDSIEESVEETVSWRYWGL